MYENQLCSHCRCVNSGSGAKHKGQGLCLCVCVFIESVKSMAHWVQAVCCVHTNQSHSKSTERGHCGRSCGLRAMWWILLHFQSHAARPALLPSAVCCIRNTKLASVVVTNDPTHHNKDIKEQIDWKKELKKRQNSWGHLCIHLSDYWKSINVSAGLITANGRHKRSNKCNKVFMFPLGEI